MSAGLTGGTAPGTTPGMIRAERLEGLLRSSSRLRQVGSVAAAAMRGVAIVVAAFLVAVAIDAGFGLPPRGLVTLDAMLLATAAIALALLIAAAWRDRYRPRRAAIQMEQASGVADSRLITAIDLAHAGSPTGSDALRRLAVERGDELAGTLSPGVAVDRSGLWRAGKLGAGALLALAIAYVALPRVFHYVVPRLAQPFADHPPFTLLDFAVTIEPERVIQGKSATIRLALSEPSGMELPSRADLVWIDGDGGRQRVPLLRSAGGAEGTNEFLLRIERAEASRAFFIDTSEGRSRRFMLNVAPVPLFESVHVRYDYPDYTGWPPSTGPIPPGGMAELRAIEDTRVTLHAASNVPLDGGTLTLFPSEEARGLGRSTRSFTPDPADPTRGTYSFTLAHSGRFEAVLRHGGLVTPEPLTGTFHAVPDAPPRVRITDPVPAVVAPEGWTVNVTLEASDDVGVSRLTLHRSVNGWGPTPLQLDPASPQRRHAATYAFDLAALGAKAGDTITYFATAWDNHPAASGGGGGGPQVAQTDVYVIQVISQEEYEEFARTQYRIDDLEAEWAAFQARLDALEAQREHLLNEMAALQEKLASGEPLTEQEQQRLDALRAELEEYRNAALDLAADLQRRAEQNALYDFEEAYKDQLARMGQELQAQASNADALSRALRDLSANLGEQAERFAQQDRPFDESTQAERQRMQEDIERVRLADEMMGAAERIRSVIERQRDLAERMRQFEDKPSLAPDEQRLADQMASEQAALREELQSARDALQDAAERAADALPNMSGSALGMCRAIDDLQVTNDQQMAAQLAGGGDGRGGAQRALTAAEKLESLLSQCNNLGGRASDDLDGCLTLSSESWQQAMQQLAQGRGVPGMSNGQGSRGAGAMGSMARMAVMGPAPRGQGEGPGESARPTAGGRGRQPAADAQTFSDAEEITPDAADERSRGVTALPGVPVQFRDIAEAYFRRLAEDEGYNRTERDTNTRSEPGDEP